jgi:hypothetical protein
MPAVGQARGGHPRPFVGREQERALLRHLLREAGTGQPAVVVVSGVPGAGKTALLHWVGDTAATAGAFVLRSSGSEGMVAFDALRRLLAVVLDDTHDLDRLSEAILAAALATLDDTGTRTPLHLLVVLAAREPVPDGSLAARALRLDAGRSLPVGGFDAQDIRDMLASSGQGASPARVRELLEVQSGARRRSPVTSTGRGCSPSSGSASTCACPCPPSPTPSRTADAPGAGRGGGRPPCAGDAQMRVMRSCGPGATPPGAAVR